MEAPRAAVEKFSVSSVKAEFIPNIVQLSSSSEKSSTGKAQETGEEATSSLRRSDSLHLSADHVFKRPRLQATTAISEVAHSDFAYPNTSASNFADQFGEFDVLEGGNLDSDSIVAAVVPQSDALDGNHLHSNGSVAEHADIVDNGDDLPDDFLEPLDSPLASSPSRIMHMETQGPQLSPEVLKGVSRQFWKAGDYDSATSTGDIHFASGVEHIRVHPKFLHSNATSHKWALGAIAELLDNALDEAVNGATFVNVDMLRNPRDGRPMLMIEDDGGGMDPERMRQCMSLGYSAKSKVANSIGQYGNGFKTSTMRLGADVLVFSCTKSKDGSLPTQSIGLLSYTFLMATGQDDIVVPMVDYEVQPFGLKKFVRGSLDDWNKNLVTLLQWSPYDSEQRLFDQLRRIKGQGTIALVYNLWEDEEGNLELDFDIDPDDIQLRGTHRDDKSMLMASNYPHCKHFFTYKYSLRSYSSILYLRLPKKFRIILRGKEVKHHRLVSDLMLVEQVKYKPVKVAVLSYKDAVTVVTLGFVKDAKEHIDVQGFNVYHKNRLIKPFWRVWNYPGIQGRGIFGVLEANFVEPAHDKQGFERTTVFARLEARLIEIQKSYWSKNCQEIGYVGNSSKKKAPSKAEVAPSSVERTSNLGALSSVPIAKDTPISSRNVETIHVGSAILGKGQVKAEQLDLDHSMPASGTKALPSQCTKEILTAPSNAVLHSSKPSTCEEVVLSHDTAQELPTPQAPMQAGGIRRSEQLKNGARPLTMCNVTDKGNLASSVSLHPLECEEPRLADSNLANDASSLDQPPATSSASGPFVLDVSGPSLQASLMSESRQDSNEALISPSSQCDMPEPSQCTSLDKADAETQQGRPRTLTRSMLQLQQSHAKAARLDSASLQELMTSSTTTDVSCLAKTIVEDGAPSVTTLATPVVEDAISLESMDVLESKLDVMKQRLRSLQSDLSKVYRERDFLKGELEEERRRQSLVEDELKKRLLSLTTKATELEAANGYARSKQFGNASVVSESFG